MHARSGSTVTGIRQNWSDVLSPKYGGWFNERVNFQANLRYAKDQYEGAGREDDLYYAEVGASYNFRRWLDIRASYIYDERDSDESTTDLDYEKNIFLIGIDLSL